MAPTTRTGDPPCPWADRERGPESTFGPDTWLAFEGVATPFPGRFGGSSR
jgi:hypothetical protein